MRLNDQYSFPRQFVELGNINFAYVDENQNAEKVVVLLHGLGTNADAWSQQFRAFAQMGYRVIAPDLRGFGYTQTKEPIVFDLMVNDVLSLLDHLQIKRFSLIGLSMGGLVSQLIALQNGHRIAKLVLVSTFAKFTPRFPAFHVRLVLSKVLGMKQIGKVVAKGTFPHEKDREFREMLEGHIANVEKRAYMEAINQIRGFDVTDRLSGLTQSTLIVTGNEDRTVRPNTQARLYQLLSGAQHVVMEGGHAPCVDHAESFNKTVIEFLEIPELTEPDSLVLKE